MTQRTLSILIFTIILIESIVIGTIVTVRVSPMVGLLATAGVAVVPFVIAPVVMFPVSLITGWRRLAKRYPGAKAAGGAPSDKMTSLSMRWWWLKYNNAIVCRADDEFLHLSLHPLFAFGTPAISIPWGEVMTIEDAALGRVRIEAGGISIWLPEKHVRQEIAVREAIEQREEEGEH